MYIWQRDEMRRLSMMSLFLMSPFRKIWASFGYDRSACNNNNTTKCWTGSLQPGVVDVRGLSCTWKLKEGSNDISREYSVNIKKAINKCSPQKQWCLSHFISYYFSFSRVWALDVKAFVILSFLVLEFRILSVLLAQVCSPLIMLEKLCCCGIMLPELRRRRMWLVAKGNIMRGLITCHAATAA